MTGHSPDTPAPLPPCTLLQMIAQQLTALGMDIRMYDHDGQLTEIVVTNIQDPERGRAIIDREGFLTWERWYGFGTSHDAGIIAQAIGVLLDDNISQRFQAVHGQPGSTQAPLIARPGAGASSLAASGPAEP